MSRFIGPDFLQHTPKRIMGSETEFTVQTDEFPKFNTIAAIQRHTVYPYSTSEVWLDNGGRLYLDMADEPILEYATPECTSATELVAYEKFGEQLVYNVASEILPPSWRSPAYKRSGYTDVFDSNRKPLIVTNSIGHHENYSTPIRYPTATEKNAIMSYLATRPLWAGAGIVTEDGFQLSQKLCGVSFYLGLNGNLTMHGSKPPVYFTDERMEIRSGDGNMSPWAIRTKFAMTSLVLRLIEHGQFPDHLSLYDDGFRHTAALHASINPSISIDLGEGRRMSSIEHQATIAAAARQFALEHAVPGEELQAAEDVLTICHELASNDPMAVTAERLADRVDWAAKFTHIRQSVGARGVRLDALTTANLRHVEQDLLWEALGPRSQSSLHYEQHGNTTASELVFNAGIVPPRSRARVRAGLLKLAELDDPNVSIDWAKLNMICDDEIFKITMGTPYYNRLKPIRRQLASLRQRSYL